MAFELDLSSSSSGGSGSASSAGTSISRFIDDEDLIDSLFFSCGVQENGKVAVSQLVEYLKFTTSVSKSNFDDFHDLYTILDPDKTDPDVDLMTYRRSVSEWVQHIRLKELQESGCDEADGDDDAFGFNLSASIAPQHLRERNRKRLSICSQGSKPMSNSTAVASFRSSNYSLEGSGCADTECPEVDISELSNRIADLEFQNKKLLDENSGLRVQLELGEDSSACLNTQVDTLTSQLKNAHAANEKLSGLRQDNEDLKTIIATLEDTRRMTNARVREAEKENAGQVAEISDLHQQVSQLMIDLDKVEQKKLELQTAVETLQELRGQAEEECLAQEAKIAEKVTQTEELKTMLRELDRVNETLRSERTELEVQLEQTLEDLTVTQKEYARLEQGEVEEDAASCSHTSDSEEELMPVRLLPVAINTPFTRKRTASICSELKNTLLKDEPRKQSPLCAKEKETIVTQAADERSQDLKVCIRDLDEMVQSLVASQTALDGFTQETVQIAEQMKKKKEKVLQDMQQASSIPTRKLALARSSATAQQQILKKEVQDFADMTGALLAMKQAVDERIKMLNQAVQKLQEHNQGLESLGDHLDAERYHNKQLQQQLALKDEQLEQLEQDFSVVQDSLKALAAEVQRLESSNEELEEKYEKAGAQMNELKTELEETTAQDVEKISKLQGNLSSAELKYQLDMHEIWRLVGKDEAEGLSDSQDTPITVSSDSLRDQVAKEIQSLRSQLARSQAALSVLQHRTAPLGQNSREYDLKNNNSRHGGNSPLVEALTLDLYSQERSHNTKGGGRLDEQGTASADSILDGHEEDPDELHGQHHHRHNSEQQQHHHGNHHSRHRHRHADRGLDPNRNLMRSGVDSISCPHLTNRLITCATQTESSSKATSKRRPPQLGTNKYNVQNTSTGSSTSGVDVSSTSSRSDIHALVHRRSVHIVETACCPPEGASSPEDPENPLCRYRTSSFKKAIESAQSGDSSNVSFDTGDPPSPDLSPERLELPGYAELVHRDGSSRSVFLAGLHPPATYQGQHRLQPPSAHLDPERNQVAPPGHIEATATAPHKGTGALATPPPAGHRLQVQAQVEGAATQHKSGGYTSSSVSASHRAQAVRDGGGISGSYPLTATVGSTTTTTTTTTEGQEHSRTSLSNTSASSKTDSPSTDAAAAAAAAAVAADDEQSPNRSRRLSTLVEESDGEVEELPLSAGRGSLGGRLPRTPKSPKPPSPLPPHVLHQDHGRQHHQPQQQQQQQHHQPQQQQQQHHQPQQQPQHHQPQQQQQQQQQQPVEGGTRTSPPTRLGAEGGGVSRGSPPPPRPAGTEGTITRASLSPGRPASSMDAEVARGSPPSPRPGLEAVTRGSPRGSPPAVFPGGAVHVATPPLPRYRLPPAYKAAPSIGSSPQVHRLSTPNLRSRSLSPISRQHRSEDNLCTATAAGTGTGSSPSASDLPQTSRTAPRIGSRPVPPSPLNVPPFVSSSQHSRAVFRGASAPKWGTEDAPASPKAPLVEGTIIPERASTGDADNNSGLSSTGRFRRQSLQELKQSTAIEEDEEALENDQLVGLNCIEASTAAAASCQQWAEKISSSIPPSPNSDFARTQSFDEGGGVDDEVFEHCMDPKHGARGTVTGGGGGGERDPVTSRSPRVTRMDAPATATATQGEERGPDPTQLRRHPCAEKQTKVEDRKGEGLLHRLSEGDPEATSSTVPQATATTTTGQLSKIREGHLAKKRGLTKQTKMPELAENSEADFSTQDDRRSLASSPESVRLSAAAAAVSSGSKVLSPAPSSPSSPALMNGGVTQDSVYPSLSQGVLSKMGLQQERGQPADCAQDLTEQDVEEKFASLALAFKTDRLTLEKRMELHQRARDIAEQNIDKELDGLKDALKAIGHMCVDSHSQDIYSKIQHHVEVLEQTTARMSSRAEVHGAVQQEFRISKAIEVMLQHMENLKRMYEREHTELEDTRRLLQENKLHMPSTGAEGDALLQRRGLSMMGATGGKGGRRRASVAVLPKVLGGAVGPSINANLPDDMRMFGRGIPDFRSVEDSKSRLQSLLSGTTSSVTKAIRRASLAFISSGGPSSAADTTPLLQRTPSPTTSEPPHFRTSPEPRPRISRTISSSSAGETIIPARTIIEEPDNQEQDSQQEASSNTERNNNHSSSPAASDGQPDLKVASINVIDEEEEELEECSGKLMQLPNLELLQQLAQQQSEFFEESAGEDDEEDRPNIVDKAMALWPGWERFLYRLRYTTAGIVFLLAVLSVVFTMMPKGSAMERHRSVKWTAVEDLLWPYLKLRHTGPPPF